MTTVKLSEYLEDQNIGTVGSSSGWSITRGKMTDSPTDMITLYDTPGLSMYRTFGKRTERPSIQIVVRAQTFTSAMTKAVEIRDLLDGSSPVISGVTFYWIEADQSPFLLNVDENQRSRVACNYSITKEP